MLITSLKRTPLIKSSNMSTWKIWLHHIASYYRLQKKTICLVVVDERICMLGMNLDVTTSFLLTKT
jgi:hypothetical protein